MSMLEQTPKWRVENHCKVCRYREFAIVQMQNRETLERMSAEKFLREHPHKVITVITQVPQDTPLKPAFQRIPF